jgi:hypothetical protein
MMSMHQPILTLFSVDGVSADGAVYYGASRSLWFLEPFPHVFPVDDYTGEHTSRFIPAKRYIKASVSDTVLVEDVD